MSDTDKKKRRPQKRRGTYAGWRCHDCGKVSATYRCAECKKKWLAKNGFSPYEIESTYEDTTY